MGIRKPCPPPTSSSGSSPGPADMRRRMKPRRGVPVWAKLLMVAATVALVVWVNVRAAEIEAVRDAAASAGYAGLLAVSVISGFNVFTPPVATFYPLLLESGFAPVPTLATIAAGMTAGDFVGYLVGNASRDLAGHRLASFRARLESMLDVLHARHRLLPYGLLFLYAAFAPVPNELVVIPLAFLRYSPAGVMTALLFGNVIFNVLVAFGVAWIFGAA